MKQFVLVSLVALILAGVTVSCKEPIVATKTKEPPCDTCGQKNDTTDWPWKDTTSHDFTWTEYTIPGEASITACWVFGPNEIWAIGGSRHSWNGTEWKKEDVIRDDGVPLEGIFSGKGFFAFSPDDAWIVSGNVYHIKDGRAHLYRLGSQFPNDLKILTDEDGYPSAAWGTSSNNMYFVGSKGIIVHFDGANWKKFPKVTGKKLSNVWGANSNYIWASGRDYQLSESVLLRFDGSNWQEEVSKKPLSQTLGFGDVRAFDSASFPVACATGGLVWRKTKEQPWGIHDSAHYPNKTPDGLRIAAGVRGNSPNDLIFASANLLIHWNGSTWKRFSNFEDLSYWTMTGHMKGNIICLAGERNGQGWVAIGRRSK